VLRWVIKREYWLVTLNVILMTRVVLVCPTIVEMVSFDHLKNVMGCNWVAKPVPCLVLMAGY